MSNFRPFLLSLASAIAFVTAAPAPLAAAVADPIRNTATLTYAAPGGDRTVLSNTVTLDVVGGAGKLPTRLSFRDLPEDFPLNRIVCRAGPNGEFIPADIDATTFDETEPLMSLDAENPLAYVLEAQGENRDPAVRDIALIAADSGDEDSDLILLTETAPNSGVFAGAIPASNIYPDTAECDLPLTRSDTVRLTFVENDRSFGSTATLLVDPEGYVFDSRTGAPVDGAVVTLIDDATGQPARVFGEDGVSAYPSTVISGGSVTDASGEVYQFDPGNYRFPLAPAGNYRFQITPPGSYVAPSVVPREAIAALRGPVGGYQIADASYGGVFALVALAPVRIDIPLDPPRASGTLMLDKTASVREAAPGDFVQYRLALRSTGSAAVTGVTVTDTLPVGMRYRAGSTRGAIEPVVAADGRGLRFAIPMVASTTIKITYLTEIVPGAPVGEAVNRATAVGTGLASNEASASVRIRAPLFTDALTIIGRVTEGACGDPVSKRRGVPGIRLLMEDGSFVVTDRDGLYHFEGVSPGTHVVQIDLASVPATHTPVACDSDSRAARSAISRFVEGGGGSLKRVDFQLRPTGVAAVAVDALPITPAADAVAAGSRTDWLDAATPGIDWMFPLIDHNPRAPAVRVVIRHAPGQRVALRLNGEPVDPLAFDGTDSDKERGVAVSRWTGLPLRDRDNLLEASVLDEKGAVVATLTRTVHYANVPIRVTYVPESSRLNADGLARPLIAVRVSDRDGRPVRAGALVPYRVDQPYMAAQEVALEQGRQLAGLERTVATARVVGDDGLAFIALEPTRQPGAVRVTVTLAEEGASQTSEIKAWLAAPATNWIVVGYGKGTIAYDTLSRAQQLAPGADGKVVTDGQLALYAKGRIKGSWLLTLAYDSDRRVDRDRGLLGTIDPDRYYTVYGDGTRQGYDAPTQRKLYLRLERRDFYALYGDFETGLVDTKLTRYSRTMNGLKAEYAGSTVHFTAFAANDDGRYGRDEIQGNGLSGPYRLSARDIVPNSDKLTIETRDRFRSEKIVASRQLTRHIDYDIDPLAGTLRFREPILSRDPELNPVFIVVDYETYGGSKKLAAGGRAAVMLGSVEVGASVVRDETFGSATVAGVDLKAKLSGNTVVRAELATGGRQGIREGQAFLAEVEHHGSRADLLAYARRQDRNFGLGQQNFGETGTQKVGLDGRLRITDRLSLAGSAWYQDELGGPAQRVAGEARLEYRRDNGIVFAGAQFASDHGVGGGGRDSRLLTLGGSQRFFKERLEITGQGQLALGGADDSVDFPARQQIGASWRFSDSVRLIANYEVAQGEKFTAQTARVGFDLAPWAGARLLTTLNQGAIGENGSRTYAQYGLSQSLPIGKRWTIDATVDSSSTLSGGIPLGDVVNPFHPTATGGVLGKDGLDGDFVAATLGATYRSERWSWNGRLEFRDSEREDRLGVTSSLLRTLGQGSTLASGIDWFRSRDAKGRTVSSVSGDIALALRPLDSRWSLLERFELRRERADTGATSRNPLAVPVFANGVQTTLRVINNVAVNYRTGGEGAGHGFEASLYYGAKYVRGRYADEKIEGFIDVTGIEIRKDIGRHFDVGANASMQHSWSSGTLAYSIGPSVGVSPAENLWLTAGYNVAGFRDRDFEDARWTRRGPYLTLRLKLDQSILGRAARLFRGDRQ